MDFKLDEAQRVIAASAAEVLGPQRTRAGRGPGRAGTGRLPAWQELAKAGLLALTLPGWMGGDDLGVLEAAVLLTEVGRQAAQVPALATIMARSAARRPVGRPRAGRTGCWPGSAAARRS